MNNNFNNSIPPVIPNERPSFAPETGAKDQAWIFIACAVLSFAQAVSLFLPQFDFLGIGLSPFEIYVGMADSSMMMLVFGFFLLLDIAALICGIIGAVKKQMKARAALLVPFGISIIAAIQMMLDLFRSVTRFTGIIDCGFFFWIAAAVTAVSFVVFLIGIVKLTKKQK